MLPTQGQLRTENKTDFERSALALKHLARDERHEINLLLAFIGAYNALLKSDPEGVLGRYQYVDSLIPDSSLGSPIFKIKAVLDISQAVKKITAKSAEEVTKEERMALLSLFKPLKEHTHYALIHFLINLCDEVLSKDRLARLPFLFIIDFFSAKAIVFYEDLLLHENQVYHLSGIDRKSDYISSYMRLAFSCGSLLRSYDLILSEHKEVLDQRISKNIENLTQTLSNCISRVENLGYSQARGVEYMLYRTFSNEIFQSLKAILPQVLEKGIVLKDPLCLILHWHQMQALPDDVSLAYYRVLAPAFTSLEIEHFNLLPQNIKTWFENTLSEQCTIHVEPILKALLPHDRFFYDALYTLLQDPDGIDHKTAESFTEALLNIMMDSEQNVPLRTLLIQIIHETAHIHGAILTSSLYQLKMLITLNLTRDEKRNDLWFKGMGALINQKEVPLFIQYWLYKTLPIWKHQLTLSTSLAKELKKAFQMVTFKQGLVFLERFQTDRTTLGFSELASRQMAVSYLGCCYDVCLQEGLSQTALIERFSLFLKHAEHQVSIGETLPRFLIYRLISTVLDKYPQCTQMRLVDAEKHLLNGCKEGEPNCVLVRHQQLSKCNSLQPNDKQELACLESRMSNISTNSVFDTDLSAYLSLWLLKKEESRNQKPVILKVEKKKTMPPAKRELLPVFLCSRDPQQHALTTMNKEVIYIYLCSPCARMIQCTFVDEVTNAVMHVDIDRHDLNLGRKRMLNTQALVNESIKPADLRRAIAFKRQVAAPLQEEEIGGESDSELVQALRASRRSLNDLTQEHFTPISEQQGGLRPETSTGPSVQAVSPVVPFQAEPALAQHGFFTPTKWWQHNPYPEIHTTIEDGIERITFSS